MAIENVIEIKQMTLNNPEFDHKKSLGILSKVSAPLAENLLHPFKANFPKFSLFRNWEKWPVPPPHYEIPSQHYVISDYKDSRKRSFECFVSFSYITGKKYK